MNNRYSPFDDVRNGTSKHLQAFRHLQGDHLGVILSDMVNGFVYLEGIIRGQLFNGIVEQYIRENILRDLVDDSSGHAWFRWLCTFSSDKPPFDIFLGRTGSGHFQVGMGRTRGFTSR